MKKVNKKVVAGILAMVILVVGMLFAYEKFREKTVDGVKSIIIEVVNDKGESVKYELKTEAKVLEEAMNEAKALGLEFSGYTGSYGFTVDTVNGVYADFINTYWAFYVNGESCNYGITEQPIKDGDVFQIKRELVSEWK